MKYIRTKDKIVNYDQLQKIGSNEWLNGRVLDIIKEADTIEELCDRFVLAGIDIIILNKEHTQYRFEDNNPYLDDYDWFDITETELKRGIHGAIWTDKGLTYVTKPMTKRGKFKLL